MEPAESDAAAESANLSAAVLAATAAADQSQLSAADGAQVSTGLGNEHRSRGLHGLVSARQFVPVNSHNADSHVVVRTVSCRFRSHPSTPRSHRAFWA